MTDFVLSQTIERANDGTTGKARRWSHNWQSRWSHHPGRNQVTLVPCSWQTTARHPHERALAVEQNSPDGAVCGWHLLRHRSGQRFLIHTTNMGGDFLSGHRWGPRPGHQWVLLHGHPRLLAPDSVRSEFVKSTRNLALVHQPRRGRPEMVNRPFHSGEIIGASAIGAPPTAVGSRQSWTGH